MIFFSSDQHWYHQNVIRYSSRPFKTIEEMNQSLVDRWNSVVGPDDMVYCLGDFSLAFRPVEVFTPRLMGNKFLVPGNHEFCHSYHKKSRHPDNQAKWIQKYQEYGWTVLPEQTTLEVPGIGTVNLCHLPYELKSGLESNQFEDKYKRFRPKHNGNWLLHGHTHEKTGKRNRGINVGVDVWNGFPASLDQLVKLMLDPREIIDPPKWGKNLLDVGVS